MARHCGSMSNRRGLAGRSYLPTVMVGPLSPDADSCSPPLEPISPNASAGGPGYLGAGRPLASADCLQHPGACFLVSKLHAPNYGAAASENLDDNRRCARRTSPVVVIPCATGRRSAKTGRGWPRCFQPRTCEAFPPRQTPFRKGKPVASFVVALTEVTSPGRERWATALQPDSPAFRPLLLKAHSQA